MQPDGLESALDQTMEKLAAAIRESAVAAKELKAAKASAATGTVRELRRALDAVIAAVAALNQAAAEARASYDFDEAEYLRSGGFSDELLASAQQQDVTMFSEDGQLLCYPSLISTLPGEAAIMIDRRKEKRLRPSVLIAELAKAQNRPPRFKAGAFLESLLRGYELLAAREDKDDPVLRLDHIWGVLTLLPGQSKEYTRPEYARDLYLLDQSQVVTTKSGRTLRLHASSGARGDGVLSTVAKTGQRQRYWGVSFSSL